MFRFSALVVAVAFITACSNSNGVSVASAPVSNARASALNTRAVDRIIDAGNPQHFGISLAIYKNGTLLYQHGYGFRDFGLGRNTFAGSNGWDIRQPSQIFHLKRGRFAPDANTIFDLGSVSKEFTGGAILLLQQDGKLSVNDKLSKYFPVDPRRRRHSAALPSAAPHRLRRLQRRNRGRERQRCLQRIYGERSEKLRHDPGSLREASERVRSRSGAEPAGLVLLLQQHGLLVPRNDRRTRQPRNARRFLAAAHLRLRSE